MATRTPFAAVVFPPADDRLPAFPTAIRAKGKTRFPGGLRRRWKDPDGTIYEWDYRHGTVEVYDRRGWLHLGDFNPVTGTQVGPADPGRSVEP
ncbi:MAG TPA: colicin E3/pyocin S6 family cytotoxin [Stellaceae bacterium]|nr:colicin E3/pyocin S6 family cytotoxin [Stellaceae bacterium]